MRKLVLPWLVLLLGAPAWATETLSLPEALRLAEARAPQIAAATARGRAASEMAVAAGELPDPVLKLGVSNVPVSGEMAWSLERDSMTMRSIGLMQEFTRSDKRQARRSRSEREADLAREQARRAQADTARDTALAWLDLSYLQRMRELLTSQIDELGLQVQAAEAAFRGGRGAQADIFALRAETARLQLQLSRMDGEIAMASARLERWLGFAPPSRLAPPPDSSRLDRPLPLGPDAGALETHPALSTLASQTALTEADVRLARANRKSDIAVELMFSQRGAAFDNMVSLNLSMPLPWNRGQRQDRELSASLAMAEQMRAEQEDMRRAYRAELAGLHAVWQNALKRSASYDKELVPLAEQQTQAALAAYRAGNGMLMAVLDARRMQLDTRMEQQRTALEAARAWAQLNFLDPQGHAAAQGVQP
jgi:outer membrane protein TolC